MTDSNRSSIQRVKWRVIAASLAAQALWLSPSSAAAENYPTRPVRFIVPSLPGGGADIVARALSLKVAEQFGQQVVVDNRAGATGTIALELAASAMPDGHTIVFLNGSATAGSTLQRTAQVALTRLTPVTQLTEQPFIMLVSNSLPVKTPAQLIAYAKERPGVLAYGSNGVGGMQHLAWALFQQRTGIDMLHVPYKSGAQILTDLGAGQIQVGFTNPIAARSHINAGRLRGIGVTTLKRVQSLPELPAVAETVPGYQATNWYGVAAPPALPTAITRVLHQAFSAALNSPDVRKWLEREGSEVRASSSTEFGIKVAAEAKRWGDVVARSRIDLY